MELGLQKLDSQAQSFFASLGKFEQLVSQHQFNIKPYSPSSIERFLSFPPEKQQKIAADFNGFLQFISEAAGIYLVHYFS